MGDILQTKNAAPPSERWPGTEWAAIETFLLGASASHALGSTGGSETVTLTVEEMPKHRHSLTISPGNLQGITGLLDYSINTSYQLYNGSCEIAGGSQPHNNMPPYTAVYIWERTA